MPNIPSSLWTRPLQVGEVLDHEPLYQVLQARIGPDVDQSLRLGSRALVCAFCGTYAGGRTIDRWGHDGFSLSAQAAGPDSGGPSLRTCSESSCLRSLCSARVSAVVPRSRTRVGEGTGPPVRGLLSPRPTATELGEARANEGGRE